MRKWVVRAGGTVIAIAGLVLALWAGISAWRSANADNAETLREPDLQVAEVLAYLDGGLSGTTQELGSTPVPVDDGMRGPVVDVRLVNRAPGSAYISKVALRVVESGTLNACQQVGGGPLWTVDYAVKIPHPLPGTPYETTTDIAEPFTVSDNDVGQVRISIGPDDDPNSAFAIWYAVVDLRLVQPEYADVPIGKVAVLAPVDERHLALLPDGSRWSNTYTYKNLDGSWINDADECLAQEAEVVDRLVALEDTVVQKDFRTLDEMYAGLGF